jgi:3-oxoadipate enol-lactonase
MWDGFDLPGATRHELRGYGNTPLPPTGEFSHAADLEERLAGEPAALVGASFGGFVCLELAARRPELVSQLVLLDAPLPDHDWSQALVDYEEQEDELLEQGEFRAAAELNAGFWLSEAAGPEVRARVIEMQERAFELDVQSEAEPVSPDVIDLGAVRARTLVAVGSLDKHDFQRIADRLSREIPGAEHAVIEGAGHLPALERPDATARLVRAFLGV